MPMDYCSRVMYKGALVSMQWTCNDEWDGVDLTVYFGSNCEDPALLTQDYTDELPGFQCSRSLQSSSCNEVSLNAFEGDSCNGDHSELRLITDECFLVEDMKYVQMECEGDSARYSIYETRNGDCSEQYLMNTTVLRAGSIDGQNAGCIEIEGCFGGTSEGGGGDGDGDASTLGTDQGETSQIIGYIVAGLVTVAFAIFAFVLTMRYKQKREVDAVQAANAMTHSGKEVPNPYGQLTSVNETTPKAQPMLNPEEREENEDAVV